MKLNSGLTRIFCLLALIGFLLMLLGHTPVVSALQDLVSATPVPISVPSPLPFATEASQSTATTTRTPTPPGPALLEALSEANVRATPDTAADKLGTIRSGDVYPIIGRYFQWYKFQYTQSASGFGWVFGDLVKIIGDETTIADLTQDAVPTLDPLSAGATGTLEAITQTPGGILTATANGGLVLPVQSGATTDSSLPALPIDSSVLPTFTYPPDAFLPTPESTQVVSPDGQAAQTNGDTSNVSLPSSIPPIAPILILGGLGLIGLFLSSYKR